MSTSSDRDRWYDIGPHGFFDLVRLARRGRTTLVRVLYLLALFAILYTVHDRLRQNDFAGDIGERMNHNARIAERFSYTILIAQCVAVMLLTPIYIAASMHEDRDNRTRGLLFTTQLSARAILQGKLLARVVQVGSVVFAGLPLLALVQLWGGIDMPLILANFWNTGLWLISIAALSLLIATYSTSIFRTVVVTYAFLACPWCCYCMPGQDPFRMIYLIRPAANVADGYFEMLLWLAMLTFIHLICAVCFLDRAVKRFEASRCEEPTPANQKLNEFDGFPIGFRALPGMSDDVIAWKERFLDRGLGHFIPLLFIPVLFVCIVGLFQIWSEGTLKHADDRIAKHVFISFVELVVMVCFGAYILLVAFGITGCIVREQQQQTLDALLLLPPPRRELLGSKLKGNLMRFWPWLALAIASWLALTLFGNGPFFARLVLLIAIGIHLAFFALVGLFLSVFSRTILSAYIGLAIVVLIVFAGPMAVGLLFNPTFFHADLLKAINPLTCWIAIGNGWRADASDDTAVGWGREEDFFAATYVCLLIYFVLSILLWHLTCRRFAQEPSRTS